MENAKGFKAFNSGLICRGKQYAENTVFEEASAEICQRGMHYCTNPFDVLDYYNLINDNGEMPDFAEVEALAAPKTDDNKKFCTTKLRIGTKLSLGGFVTACVDYLMEKTKICSDDYAQMASSGNYAQMASSGDYAKMASSGYSAKMASSGDSAKMASSGNFAQMASSGNSAQMASSGNSAQMASSGYSAQMASSGIDSVICCAGVNGRAKAKKGSWITLSEWVYSGEKDRMIPVCVKTEQVDGERIKEDTFYELKNGVFMEVNG